MGILRQGFQVADPVVAGSGPKNVPKSERGQGGIAPGAAAVNGQPLVVHLALSNQVPGAVNAVVHIHDAPASPEPVPVGPAIAGTAAIVHIQNGNAPAGPILEPQVKSGGGRRRWPAVALDQQRRQLPGRSGIIPVLRRVVEGISGQPVFGGKFDTDRRRQITGVHRNRTGLLQYFQAAANRVNAQVKTEYRNGFSGRACAKNRLPRRHLQTGSSHLGIGDRYRIELAGNSIQLGQLPGAQVGVSTDNALRRSESVGGRAENPVGLAELQRQRRRDRFHRAVTAAVQVPPAGAVGDKIQDAVGRPFRLADGFGSSASHHFRRTRDQGAVRRHRRSPKLGTFPGHIGVIPGQPGQSRTVRAEARRGVKVAARHQDLGLLYDTVATIRTTGVLMILMVLTLLTATLRFAAPVQPSSRQTDCGEADCG